MNVSYYSYSDSVDLSFGNSETDINLALAVRDCLVTMAENFLGNGDARTSLEVLAAAVGIEDALERMKDRTEKEDEE